MGLQSWGYNQLETPPWGNMVLLVRTTILLDDELGKRLREAADQRGQSLSAFLAEAGRAALEEAKEASPAFELLTYGTDGVVPGINLDRTRGLVVAEDERAFGSDR